MLPIRTKFFMLKVLPAALIAFVGVMLMVAQKAQTVPSSTSDSDIEASLIHQNISRKYVIHLPQGFHRRTSYPLVLAFHGSSGTPSRMKSLTNFNQVADREGFIVVYPAGYEQTWADSRNETPAGRKGIDDVGFISKLIDKLVQDYAVDPKQVYATGISNGGNFSQRLGCELADKVAVIGVVAAGMPTNLADTCKPSRPVPMVLMFGESDPLYPFQGGSTKLGSVLSVDDAIAKRVALNQCSGRPQIVLLPDTAPRDGTRIKRTVYTDCKNRANVEYYLVEGGGHTWPGGTQYLPARFIGKTSRDLNASDELWAFFSQFQMPLLPTK
jgi:polyhydroxybutyrate depolymerase